MHPYAGVYFSRKGCEGFKMGCESREEGYKKRVGEIHKKLTLSSGKGANKQKWVK